ncbi:hypothetical protein AFLA70_82g003302 [Aspergillus flavus AF70]|nr:hypothetical protein AFLA70_82g003302 [Aspergillus flavus AF70]
MPRYVAIVRYSTLESFGQCDKDIETMCHPPVPEAMTTGLTMSNILISSLQPQPCLLFVVPYDLPEDALDGMKLADGLLILIRRE